MEHAFQALVMNAFCMAYPSNSHKKFADSLLVFNGVFQTYHEKNIAKLVDNAIVVSSCFQYHPFMGQCLVSTSPVSVLCDTISLCNHLVRTSAEHIPLVKTALHSNKGKML